MSILVAFAFGMAILIALMFAATEWLSEDRVRIGFNVERTGK